MDKLVIRDTCGGQDLANLSFPVEEKRRALYPKP
jgi:hypothetical protein